MISQSHCPLPSLTNRSQAWRATTIGLDESDPVVGRMALAGEGFLRRAINNSRDRGTWFLIYGGTGCGKSHMAKRVVNLFRAWAVDAYSEGKWSGARIPRAAFVDWPTMHDDPNFSDRLEELADVDLVALDDVGGEVDKFKDGTSSEKLRKVLNLFANRWVLITTNLTDRSLAATYDSRVVSRIAQAGALNVHGAPDYRRKLGGKAA